MSKKKEIPTNDPTKSQANQEGQRPGSPTRGDIKKVETDYVNPNNGAQQKSQRKT